jgi:hypothetical protein
MPFGWAARLFDLSGKTAVDVSDLMDRRYAAYQTAEKRFDEAVCAATGILPKEDGFPGVADEFKAELAAYEQATERHDQETVALIYFRTSPGASDQSLPVDHSFRTLEALLASIPVGSMYMLDLSGLLNCAGPWLTSAAKLTPHWLFGCVGACKRFRVPTCIRLDRCLCPHCSHKNDQAVARMQEILASLRG